MLIKQEDNTFIAGPKDVICVLHDVENDRYHVAFFEEKFFPGGRSIEGGVRLKSKMHNTKGSATLEDELVELDKLCVTIKVPEANVWRDPKPWDGVIGSVWMVPDWTKEAATG